MNQWQPQVGRMQADQRGIMRTVQQLVKSGKLEEARTIISKLVAENPEFAFGHLLLGNINFRQKRYAEALAEYQLALQGNPGLAPAPLMMGMVYRILQEPRNALEHFELAIEIDPDLVLAHVEKGRVQLTHGQVEDAMGSVKTALAVNPQAVPARLLMAEIHAHGNNDQKALEILQDLVTDRPELVIAQSMLGMLYLKLNRLEEAKASLKTVTQLAPGRPFPLYMLGNVHYKLQELNAAEKCYRDALAAGKSFVPAMYALADLLAGAKRYPEAMGILNGILLRSRRTNAVHQRLGAIYTAQARYSRAVEEFRAALKHDAQILERDPTIELVLQDAHDPEAAAKAFLERLKAIRVQVIGEFNAMTPQERVRARRERNMSRVRAAVSS